MTSRRQLLRQQAERYSVERLIAAKAHLSSLLIEYGRLTGRPEAFEAALLLHLLDISDPRIADAFDRAVPQEMVIRFGSADGVDT